MQSTQILGFVQCLCDTRFSGEGAPCLLLSLRSPVAGGMKLSKDHVGLNLSYRKFETTYPAKMYGWVLIWVKKPWMVFQPYK